MKKILIADDEQGIVDVLQDILEQHGYETVTAMDGMQAMMQAVKQKPDLILLDIMLPAGSGYTVYNRLKQSTQTHSIPIIILTATPIPKVRENLPKGDTTLILPKPWNSKELLGHIEALTNRGQAPQVPPAAAS